MKVRVKFRKYGPIRFIGHLDVMSFFQQAIRRAEIDIAYTGGFSPHQIMSFAAPLGVGLESNGEYMDIEVNSVSSSRDMVTRLNGASADGIEIVDVKALPDKAGNAMASVAAAEYTVAFREGKEPSCVSGLITSRQQIKAFLDQEKIMITKETKKGTMDMDLKPGIYEFSCSEEGFHMLVDASSAGNIKPAMVIDAYLSFCGEKLLENALFITRQDLYTRSQEGALISLNEVGSEIIPQQEA